MFGNLKNEMSKQNLTIKKIAKDLDWNYNTLWNKFNGVSDWYRNEMLVLKNKYFKNRSLEYLFKKNDRT